MRRPILAALAMLVALAACSSPRSGGSGSSTSPSAGRSGGTSAGFDARSGMDAVENAVALWTRIRTNAEKALATGAADPNRGWLERALESDGRALIAALGRPGFEAFAAERDEIRARLVFVIRPPAPDDRREAVKAVDEAFAALRKRKG